MINGCHLIPLESFCHAASSWCSQNTCGKDPDKWHEATIELYCSAMVIKSMHMSHIINNVATGLHSCTKLCLQISKFSSSSGLQSTKLSQLPVHGLHW